MLAIIHTLTPINEDFQKHLTMLNMYRSTLGTAVEASWIQMLNFCKRLVWHIDLLGKSTPPYMQRRKPSTRTM